MDAGHTPTRPRTSTLCGHARITGDIRIIDNMTIRGHTHVREYINEIQTYPDDGQV